MLIYIPRSKLVTKLALEENFHIDKCLCYCQMNFKNIKMQTKWYAWQNINLKYTHKEIRLVEEHILLISNICYVLGYDRYYLQRGAETWSLPHCH